MLRAVALKRGSLISAMNLCLLLSSPSHSVFTKRLDTRASSAAASRFTCASFHIRSRTINLLSRGSACWAAIATVPRASRRQQKVRFISHTLAAIPTWGKRAETITVHVCRVLWKWAEESYERHKADLGP